MKIGSGVRNLVGHGQSETLPAGMHRCREVVLFLFASLLLSWVVFGDALLGRSITAPVDIAPALWEGYRHVDPQTNGVPQNYLVVDQLSYDLPLQWSIYHAYRRGEIPWWDPYTYAGRPLLADSHINGTDPVRVALYLTVPDFVLAYNWTLAAHHLVLSLGLFVLLRFLGLPPVIAGALALAGQVAGGFVIFVGHPWVTGSLCWYPWIWWVWAKGMERPRRWTVAAGAAFSACVFYAGNLQSHAYLPIFGLCFLLGSAGMDGARWKRGLWIVCGSGILGALLAAPALGPTLELFRLNDRPIVVSTWSPGGVAMLAAVWPWSLGTFRSVGYGCISYCYFLGPLAAILVAAGLRAMPGESSAVRLARRTSWWVLGFIFVFISTPLSHLVYVRIAGLGSIAVTVLAALGACRLIALATEGQRKLAKVIGAWTVLVVAGTLFAVYVVYPRVRPRIEAFMLTERSHESELFKPLRQSQVDRYPSEVNFTNPEVGVALAALILFVAAAQAGRLRPALPWLLLVSALSPALVAGRYVPRQSLVLWERLKAGSEEQRRVIAQVGTARLDEGNRLFPQEITHLYGVHLVTGYAALLPRSQVKYPDPDPAKVADWEYNPKGVLTARRHPPGNRFLWVGNDERPMQVRPEGLNGTTVSFPAGPAAELLRTDTYYPGWKAATAEGREVAIRQQGLMSVLEIPAGATGLVLRYQPTGWNGLLVLAGVGALVAVLSGIVRPKAAAVVNA